MIKIGTKIKKVRELKNVTQQFVADKLGMTQGYYSRIENNSLSVDDELLAQIAEILGVEKEEIENFDDKVILNNPTINDNGTGVHFCNLVNYYAIDPKLEKLYENQIEMLKEQNKILLAELKELKKRS